METFYKSVGAACAVLHWLVNTRIHGRPAMLPAAALSGLLVLLPIFNGADLQTRNAMSGHGAYPPLLNLLMPIAGIALLTALFVPVALR